MRTSVGKIGRLPRELREQVNERMENGERAAEILTWLNGLPVVQAILITQFGGKAINEPNLSHWRTGGYLVWRARQDQRAMVRQYFGKEGKNSKSKSPWESLD